MAKKEIQEQRMKNYFIQATKEILKGEGLRNISVRNIAERAGYSYATLYNYFKDVKDLIFLCVSDFQEECEQQVTAAAADSPAGMEKIKVITKSYMNYFVQYPGIFELFYLERVSDISHKQPTSELIYNFLDRLTSDEWRYCLEQNIVSEEQAALIKAELRNTVAGLLLFYLNRRQPDEYGRFIQLTDRLLDKILQA